MPSRSTIRSGCRVSSSFSPAIGHCRDCKHSTAGDGGLSIAGLSHSRFQFLSVRSKANIRNSVLGFGFLAHDLAVNCSTGPILNYVPFKQLSGSIPWAKSKDPECFENAGAKKEAESKSAYAAYSNSYENAYSHTQAKGAAESDVTNIGGLTLPVVISTLLVFIFALWLILGKESAIQAATAPVAAGIEVVSS
jgi:hypothetical protein